MVEVRLIGEKSDTQKIRDMLVMNGATLGKSSAYPAKAGRDRSYFSVDNIDELDARLMPEFELWEIARPGEFMLQTGMYIDFDADDFPDDPGFEPEHWRFYLDGLMMDRFFDERYELAAECRDEDVHHSWRVNRLASADHRSYLHTIADSVAAAEGGELKQPKVGFNASDYEARFRFFTDGERADHLLFIIDAVGLRSWE